MIYDLSLIVNILLLIFHYTLPIIGMKCSFRENLRNELDYQGIVVKELSARTGIPVATLDCYLSNRKTVPSVEAAVKIARALQVSVEYLVLGEKPSSQNKLKEPSREALEIIRFIENLSTEQCKAILKLLDVFKEKT